MVDEIYKQTRDKMQKTLDILDHKIEVYEKTVLKKEKEALRAEE